MGNELLLALILVLLAAVAVALLLMRRIQRRLGVLEQALTRAEARGREQALRLEVLDRLRDGQQLTEQVLDTGTTLTREVHKGIASIPFSILENIPKTAANARATRKLHDSISNDIYDALGTLNRRVGQQLRGDDGRKTDTRTTSAPSSDKKDKSSGSD